MPNSAHACKHVLSAPALLTGNDEAVTRCGHVVVSHPVVLAPDGYLPVLHVQEHLKGGVCVWGAGGGQGERDVRVCTRCRRGQLVGTPRIMVKPTNSISHLRGGGQGAGGSSSSSST